MLNSIQSIRKNKKANKVFIGVGFFIIAVVSFLALGLLIPIIKYAFFPPFVPGGINVYDYCQTSFQKTQNCPLDACEMGCSGNDSSDTLTSKGCAGTCLPKPCYQFNVRKCPKDRCQVEIEWNGEKVCNYKSPANDLP